MIGFGDKGIHRVTAGMHHIETSVLVQVDDLERARIIGRVWKLHNDLSLVLASPTVEIDFYAFKLLAICNHKIQLGIAIHISDLYPQYAMSIVKRLGLRRWTSERSSNIAQQSKCSRLSPAKVSNDQIGVAITVVIDRFRFDHTSEILTKYNWLRFRITAKQQGDPTLAVIAYRKTTQLAQDEILCPISVPIKGGSSANVNAIGNCSFATFRCLRPLCRGVPYAQRSHVHIRIVNGSFA